MVVGEVNELVRDKTGSNDSSAESSDVQTKKHELDDDKPTFRDELNERVNSKTDFQMFLKEKLEEDGWDVVHHPDQHRGYYKPDLIISKHRYHNLPIGIQTAYTTSDKLGTALGNALIEIEHKYRDAGYFSPTRKVLNGVIPTWAYIPYVVNQEDSPHGSTWGGFGQYERQLLSRYGIGHGVIDDEYTEIVFNVCRNEMKVPLFGGDGEIPDRRRHVDQAAILDYIHQRRDSIEEI